MTAVAWAILMYLMLAFPEVKLSNTSNNMMIVCFLVICLLTIKDLFSK